jgi:exodeoxyribonuclease V
MTRQFTTPAGEHLTLDASQDAAVDVLLDRLKAPGSEATLAGAAGCGKSVLLFVILKEWTGGVLLMAPTGKAANRASETTGRTVRTIHGSVFKTVEEVQPNGSRREALVFGEPDTPKGCGRNTLVIVDEASMVNERLAQTLREVVFAVGGRILWVGDHEQLPPVEGRWGARLDRPTAVLETVHRQALESAVLELATMIRTGTARDFTRWGDDVERIFPAKVEQAVAWAEEGRKMDVLLAFTPDENQAPSRVLLTWTNKVRVQANRLTRKARGYAKGVVQVGETLICTFNNHSLGRMNGELVEVHRVEECPEMTKCLGVPVQWVIEQDSEGVETKFLVLPETFDAYHPRKSDRQVYREAWGPLWAKNQPKANRDGTMPESAYRLMDRMGWSWDDLREWRNNAKIHGLQTTWGYCLTVHKSQGSQWDEVGFISCPQFRAHDDHEFKRRLTYTAVTRAAERFTAFMLRVVPDYRKKNPYQESE